MICWMVKVSKSEKACPKLHDEQAKWERTYLVVVVQMEAKGNGLYQAV